MTNPSGWMATDIVKLNVGGTIYTTTRTTLTNVGENMLYVLVSGKFNSQLVDGAYFVDRDDYFFRDVLNYLRNFNITAFDLPDDSNYLRQLKREAEFYALTSLIQLIDERLEHQKKIVVIYFRHSDHDRIDIVTSENELKGELNRKFNNVTSEDFVIKTLNDHNYKLIETTVDVHHELITEGSGDNVEYRSNSVAVTTFYFQGI